MKKMYNKPLAELIAFELEDMMLSTEEDFVIVGGGNGVDIGDDNVDEDFGNVGLPIF